jgi:hypothetical protein
MQKLFWLAGIIRKYNHSLLTASVCKQYSINVLGWIFNDQYMQYEEEIVQWSGYKKIGSVSFTSKVDKTFIKEEAEKISATITRRIMTKKELREIYKEKRAAISSKEKLKLDDALLINFQRLYFEDVAVLLTYWAKAEVQEPFTHLFSGFLRHSIPDLQIAYPKWILPTTAWTPWR